MPTGWDEWGSLPRGVLWVADNAVTTSSAATTTAAQIYWPPADDTTAGGVVWADNSSATWSITSLTTSASNYPRLTTPLVSQWWGQLNRQERRRAAATPLADALEWQPNYYGRLAMHMQAAMQEAARQVDPEYIAAQELRRAEQNAPIAEQNARITAQAHEHARANSRAEILLHEHLNPAQVDELAARGHFHLDAIARNGERKRYRIRRGRHGNVDQVDAQGRVVKSLCVHPSVQCPDADTMLAQKLWLETNEPELLRVANVVPR